MSQEQPLPMTYAQAGVDVDAAARLVERIGALARSTRRPEVLADVGPFGGLFRLSGYRDAVLVASADGVGTKLKLAALLGRFQSVGMDLVNHCVNDIFCAGAEPLFFLDYIASGSLSDDERAAIVEGVAESCRAAGCALLGGETADLPDVYGPGDFDLVGFIVGVVERDAIIDGASIRAGDALLGLPSSGLHTNGYTLVRKVFGVGVGGDAGEERARLERRYSELGASLGDALLAVHRCYYNELSRLIGIPTKSGKPVLGRLKGIAHITGGGLPGNLPRILPDGLAARLHQGAWPVPPIFRLIQERGNVAEDEMFRAFNMGLGMVLVCDPSDVEAVRAQVAEALVVGEVVRGERGERRAIIE
jgi:phosphoribosylformylglycinamidine cyclo-ligase